MCCTCYSLEAGEQYVHGKFNGSPKRGNRKAYIFLNGSGLFTVLDLC